MFRRWLFIWFAVVFAPISLAASGNSTADQNSAPSLNSLSEVIQVISAAQDWNSEEVAVSNIDTAAAKFGKTQSHELDVQVGEKVFPARFVDELTFSRYPEEKETGVDGGNSFGGLKSANLAAGAALLPFQMEGPLEVWIEEADNLQLVMPVSEEDIRGDATYKAWMNSTVGFSSVEKLRLKKCMTSTPIGYLYLIPSHRNVGKFVYTIRKRINLDSKKAMFIFVNNVLPPTSALMGTLYEEHKDEDGILYVTYNGENTFGQNVGTIMIYPHLNTIVNIV